MKFKRFTCTAFGLLAVGGVAWGCSGQSSDCTANENCGAFDAGAGSDSGGSTAHGGTTNGGAPAGGSGGKSGASGASGTSSSAAGEGGGAGAPDAGCDGTLSPDVDQCVIDNDYGLFVSNDGDDTTGNGTQETPFATVTKALSATGPGKVNRVYVCAGTEFYEPGTIVIPDSVSIYGGFSCDGGAWLYDASGATKALLKPASPVGAMIDTATHGVTLQDVRIDAANAPEDGTGASSFGMTINASKGVVLNRVEIHAGKGGGGKAGTDGTKGADGVTSTATQNGGAASCALGAPSPLNGALAIAATCGSKGGSGGSGVTGITYQGPEDGFDGTPAVNIDPSPNANGGKGASVVGGTHPGASGTIGSGGLPGARGTSANPTGAFSSDGYVPAGGGNGSVGFPGQGGGGGGASLGGALCVGASGAAGGMGGCGGDPGTGGIGGGASVALLSWSSTLSMSSCILVASTGGAGGRGGNAHAGGVGKAGGSGGAGDNTDGIGGGGDGGKGGPGGNGGNGAGGTGGPSIALVYSGTRPDDSMSPATLTKGTAGALGLGGKVSGTSTVLPGFDGKPGQALAEYPVP